jgi:hypothetical protein
MLPTAPSPAAVDSCAPALSHIVKADFGSRSRQVRAAISRCSQFESRRPATEDRIAWFEGRKLQTRELDLGVGMPGDIKEHTFFQQ